MSSFDKLIKKIHLFEKIATAGNRLSALLSIAQDASLELNQDMSKKIGNTVRGWGYEMVRILASNESNRPFSSGLQSLLGYFDGLAGGTKTTVEQCKESLAGLERFVNNLPQTVDQDKKQKILSAISGSRQYIDRDGPKAKPVQREQALPQTQNADLGNGWVTLDANTDFTRNMVQLIKTCSESVGAIYNFIKNEPEYKQRFDAFINYFNNIQAEKRVNLAHCQTMVNNYIAFVKSIPADDGFNKGPVPQQTKERALEELQKVKIYLDEAKRTVPQSQLAPAAPAAGGAQQAAQPAGQPAGGNVITLKEQRIPVYQKIDQEVQRKLNSLLQLSEPLKVDGLLGKKTRAAIKQYADSRGLTGKSMNEIIAKIKEDTGSGGGGQTELTPAELASAPPTNGPASIDSSIEGNPMGRFPGRRDYRT